MITMMNINFNDNTSYYVNPNTRTLTTSIKNTEVSDRSYFDSVQMKLRPVDDMQRVLSSPIKLAGKTYLSRATNSINIAEGAKITVGEGFVLTVKSMGVEVSGGNIDNDAARQEAMEMGGALSTLLRNACGMMKNVAFSQEGIDKWNANVSKVLGYFGIDTNRDFTVNGMKYTKDSNGRFIAQEALAAYERSKSVSRALELSDESTKAAVSHMSNYYLKNAPEEISDAWQKTIEETGINPFPQGYMSVLQQLSMEQDFATNGNDDIFGNTVESSTEAVEKILDRIEQLLESSDKVEYLTAEKTFYSTLLETINS